jgi:hypothetical protein|tara:strand:- start:97583 stop:97786 length:204 start_codon:yes stop_codon:yes gene_type:complete
MKQNQSTIAIMAIQRKERLQEVGSMKYIGGRKTCKSVRVIGSNVRFNRINQRMRAELIPTPFNQLTM